MRKNITLTFDLGQVTDDLLVRCNLLSRNVGDEARNDLKADVATPDSESTRSMICRALTEAAGNLKYAAQRWLTTGRTADDNRLERIVKPTADGSVAYEKVTLTLRIPGFNTGVTDTLKSHMHRYLVDYTLGQFLHDLLPDAAKVYSADAAVDYDNVKKTLQARVDVPLRQPTWI